MDAIEEAPTELGDEGCLILGTYALRLDSLQYSRINHESRTVSRNLCDDFHRIYPTLYKLNSLLYRLTVQQAGLSAGGDIV